MLNFVIVESIYGKFILNRHDKFQYKPLRNTGIPHINDQIMKTLDIINVLDDNSVVLDGGANIGLITIPIAQTNKCVVYSFEPQKQIYNCLCGNIVINNLNNVYTFKEALGSSKGKLYFPNFLYNIQYDFGSCTLQQEGEIPIDVITIDSLNLSRLDFLKLDVETMEVEVLNGGIETITKFKPICWIEYMYSDIENIKNILKPIGYRLFDIDGVNLLAICNNNKNLLEKFNWLGKEFE